MGLLFAVFSPTASAVGLDVARHVTEALDARLPSLVTGWGQPLRENVLLALHEAISNAIVHGNLGLPSMERRSLDDLETFSDQLHQRLSTPDLAEKPVWVAVALTQPAIGTALLTAVVQDDGLGHAQSLPAAGQEDGRGLQIIAATSHAVRFCNGGRRIEMDFAV